MSDIVSMCLTETLSGYDHVMEQRCSEWYMSYIAMYNNERSLSNRCSIATEEAREFTVARL